MYKLFQNTRDAPQDDGDQAKGSVMLDTALIAHDQPSAIIPPAKAPFHLPAVAVPRPHAKGSAALRSLPGAALKRRHRRLNTPPPQWSAKGLAVIPLVGHQLLRPCTWAAAPLRDLHRRQGRLGQCAFVWAGARHRQPDRQAMAVGNNHHLRALADFGLPDAGAPFFAGTKLPSKNACAHSSLPRASSWPNNIRHIRSQVPSRDQTWKRRQHVAGEPYARGASSQVQPVFGAPRDAVERLAVVAPLPAGARVSAGGSAAS